MNALDTIIAPDKVYVNVDSLLDYLETRREEAYWTNGEGFRSKLSASLSKLRESLKPEAEKAEVTA